MVQQLDHQAILVNPHADRARNAARSLGEILAPEHVWIASDDTSYDDLVGGLLDRDYQTIFTAGGDGTAHRFINALLDAAPHRVPRLGVLPMGSGNGLASLVSGGDPYADLRTFLRNPTTDVHRLPLCETEGTRFAFAGLGLDAAVLEDYHALRRNLLFGPLRALRGASGHLAALLGLTFPRRLFRRRVHARVVNVGAPAWAIDQRPGATPAVERTIARGEVLYEGPLNAAVMGTCEHLGHGFRLLPFAGLERTRFHLRLSHVPPLRLMWGLRALRRGDFHHPGVHDFLVERVEIELSEPMPFQLDGELMGARERLCAGLAHRDVDLVCLL